MPLAQLCLLFASQSQKHLSVIGSNLSVGGEEHVGQAEWASGRVCLKRSSADILAQTDKNGDPGRNSYGNCGAVGVDELSINLSTNNSLQQTLRFWSIKQ